jgi:predicted unusual protein kinase regulating ubiquinone biosynthesis (AarF/ABC1/UbiB family)
VAHSAGLQTGGLRRAARLASLPVGAALLAVEGRLRRLAGEDAETVGQRARERNAARTRRVLGDLKGGALKAGQLLSTVETLFPPDPEQTWRQALTALQEDNPPLPFERVEPVLAAELGRRWWQALPELDRTHAAAASLGQVHRGRWRDGRDVAVKVQYPGAAEALTGDVRALAASLRLTTLVARGLALPPLVAELRTRLAEELDYLHEGAAQARFAEAYADDQEAVVPGVVAATPRVLVTEWLDGTPLAQVARTGTSAQRNRSGRLYQRFLLSGPERVGLLHTDPHPGNFRLLPDGRLGVLDFGSTLGLTGGMPATFGRLMRVMLSADPDEVRRGLVSEGLLRPGARIETEKLVDYLGPFAEPARHEQFHYSREWLRGQFARVNDPRNPEFGVALQLSIPAEHLFTHRVWLGVLGVLCQLEATVPVRPELERWLPGFAAPAPA